MTHASLNATLKQEELLLSCCQQKEGILKIRHYLLIIVTLLTIAFLQPLVLFLGNFTLIAGVMALIFADLPPERQDAWEMKVAGLLKQLRTALRNDTRRLQNQKIGEVSRSEAIFFRKQTIRSRLKKNVENNRQANGMAQPEDKTADYNDHSGK